MYLVMFLLLTIGTVFTDLPILDKTVTRSLMFIIAPVLFIVSLLLRNFRVYLTKNLKIFILYAIYTLTSSLVILMLFVFLTGEPYVYQKNLLVKLFESFFSLILLHLIVYYLLIIVFKHLNIDRIKVLVLATFLFLTVVGFVEYFNPNIISIFQLLSFKR